MREVRANAKCPCESGRGYGNCCKRRSFRWLVDSEGDFHKELRLPPGAQEAIERAREAYATVFERKPDKDKDPVFLGKYLLSEEELARQAEEAMERAGVPPQIIYAHRKTGGLILTKENQKFASTKDVQDWEAAVDEYFRLQEDPPEPDPLEVLFHSVEAELDSCIICLGYVLENGLDANALSKPSSSSFFSVDEYVLLCATKSMKTLRSIKALLNENIGADGLALARHILENYFHIVFAISKPEMLEHLVDAQIGLKLGTHDFARSTNGRVDSRRILRKADGAVFQGHISYYKMAESSPHGKDCELFDYMYSFLSEYTHPSFSGFKLVVGEEGTLDALSNELRSEAMFFSVCFAALVLDQLRSVPLLSYEAKRDIATVVRRIRSSAVLLIEAMFEEHELNRSFAVLRDRLAAIGA